MNYKIWRVLAVAILSGAAVQPLIAESDTDNFKKLDTDRDNYISEEEARGNAALRDRWSEVDENQDGRVDTTEFSAFEMPGSAENSEPAE